jgi:hypothetical protein
VTGARYAAVWAVTTDMRRPAPTANDVAERNRRSTAAGEPDRRQRARPGRRHRGTGRATDAHGSSRGNDEATPGGGVGVASFECRPPEGGGGVSGADAIRLGLLPRRRRDADVSALARPGSGSATAGARRAGARRDRGRSAFPVTRSGSRMGPSVHPVLWPAAGAVDRILPAHPLHGHRPNVREGVRRMTYSCPGRGIFGKGHRTRVTAGRCPRSGPTSPDQRESAGRRQLFGGSSAARRRVVDESSARAPGRACRAATCRRSDRAGRPGRDRGLPTASHSGG